MDYLFMGLTIKFTVLSLSVFFMASATLAEANPARIGEIPNVGSSLIGGLVAGAGTPATNPPIREER